MSVIDWRCMNRDRHYGCVCTDKPGDSDKAYKYRQRLLDAMTERNELEDENATLWWYLRLKDIYETAVGKLNVALLTGIFEDDSDLEEKVQLAKRDLSVATDILHVRSRQKDKRDSKKEEEKDNAT